MTLIQQFQTDQRQKAFTVENKHRALILTTENGQFDSIQPLLNMGADMTCEGNVGGKGERGTSLHHAARNGHTAIVKLLLFKVIDTEAISDLGRIPLEYSVCNGHEELPTSAPRRPSIGTLIITGKRFGY